MIIKIVEENHIDFPKFTRGWECKQGNCKHAHDLCVWEKQIYDIYFSDGYVFYLPYDISESESFIPYKKPQSVHQSFLQKLVIFH